MLSKVETSHNLWKVIAEECGWATFFHTPYWAWLITTLKGIKFLLPLTFKTKNGYILLPLYQTRIIKGFYQFYESVPIGLYGGPICNFEPDEGILMDFRKRIFELTNGNYIFTSPPDVKNFPVQPYSFLPTHIKFLKDLITSKKKNLTRGHRYALCQAEKAGLKVSLAKEKKDYLKYYNLYQLYCRWKKRRQMYNLEFLMRASELQDLGITKLWIVNYEKEMVAGLLVAYFKDWIYCIHTANNPHYLNLFPNHLLLWEVMKEGNSKGYRWLDLLPSGAYQKVDVFKKGFKPIRKNVEVYVGRNFTLRTLLNLRKIVRG